MAIHLRGLLMGHLGDVRYEPIDKRIRGVVGGETVVDSTHVRLVWEPKRVVPSYAFPVDAFRAQIVAVAPSNGANRTDDAPRPQRLGDRSVYDPSIPFSVHTTEGTPVIVRAGDREAAGFRPDDADLADYVLVDFEGFDEWYEEDERNVAHPRDPFHRIDILHSSRHVRVELAGTVLAESSSPYLLFEPPLPVRYYLPAEDVRSDLLRPTDSHTFCAYKGQASYWSAGDEDDLAWTYQAPLRDALEVTDRIVFFNERVDLIVDGVSASRPVTPWSRA